MSAAGLLPSRPVGLGSWLSEAWHTAGPEIAAAAAIATGNPELAVPAANAAKAAGGGQPRKPKVEAPQAVALPPQGFRAAFDQLTPLDRQIVVTGGAVVGALILARALFPPRYGRR